MTDRIMVGFNNAADDASLTGGSWTIGLSWLQDARPREKARSADASLASTKFRIDLGSSTAIQLIALTATNLSSAADYRITWYSDAFITLAGNTGWLPVPGYPAYDPDNRGPDICHIFDAAETRRYWEFELDDTANPAGYVEAGRLLMSEIWQPSVNFGEGNAETLEPNTTFETSLGGTEYPLRRMPKRALRVSWSVLPESEMAELRRFRAIVGIDRQVYVVPDPDDTANYNYRNFLARVRTPPEIALLPASLASSAMDFVEMV